MNISLHTLAPHKNGGQVIVDLLTKTEAEILRAIAQGKTTKEIADERFSSIHTITTHRKNIFRKLGIHTVHAAIKYALCANLVAIDDVGGLHLQSPDNH